MRYYKTMLCRHIVIVDRTPQDKLGDYYFPGKKQFTFFPEIIFAIPADKYGNAQNRKLCSRIVRELNNGTLTKEQVKEWKSTKGRSRSRSAS